MNFWRISDSHGLCIVTEGREERMIADFSPPGYSPTWNGRREDAEEIVKAHNALEIMKAWKWNPSKSPCNDEGWRVDMNEGCYFAYGKEDDVGIQVPHWPCPYEAITEAYKWYTRNHKEYSGN